MTLNRPTLARAITLIESTRADHQEEAQLLLNSLLPKTGKSIRIGISGEGQKNSADIEEQQPDLWFRSLDALQLSGRRVRKGEPLFPRRDAKPA